MSCRAFLNGSMPGSRAACAMQALSRVSQMRKILPCAFMMMLAIVLLLSCSQTVKVVGLRSGTRCTGRGFTKKLRFHSCLTLHLQLMVLSFLVDAWSVFGPSD